MAFELGIPYLEHLSYLAIPFLVALSSAGLPEEAALLVTGYLVFEGVYNVWIAWLLALVCVVVADNVHFLLGNGGHFLLRKVVREKTVARLKWLVDRWGPWAVFVTRFIPGARIVTLWIAGTSGMRWAKFAFANFLGIFIEVPLVLAVGYWLGPRIDRAVGFVKTVDDLVGIAVVILFVTAAIVVCLQRRNVRSFLAIGGANGRS